MVCRLAVLVPRPVVAHVELGLNVSAPVGHTAMQLPQYTQAESGSGRPTRSRCGRRSRGRRPRWRTCSATARRTRRRTCSRGCTGRSPARRGRCRPWRAGRRWPRRRRSGRGRRRTPPSHAATFGAVERSTDEPSSSSTSCRAWRVRSVSVCTTMPSSAGREHDGHQHAAAVELDHADAARVLRRERLAVAERRHVDAGGAAGVEEVEPSVTRIALAVDGQLDEALGRVDRSRERPERARRPTAMALAAVWPRPQIDASCITGHVVQEARSDDGRRRPTSAPTGCEPHEQPPAGGRCRRGTARTGRSSRRGRSRRCARATARGRRCRRARSPRPSRGTAPIGRVPSNVSGVSSRPGPTNRPATPPSSTACSGRPPATPPARSRSSPQRRPERHLVHAGPRDVPDRQNSFVPVERPVPVAANASPPCSTIGSTLTSVSTLFATVGWPKRPTSTGNGGLLRGSPR